MTGPSRRELLTLAGALGTFGCVRPLRFALTNEDERLLGELADGIAPGGAGLPAASAAGAVDHLARQLAAASGEERALVGRGLARVRAAPGDRTSQLAQLDPECFDWIRRRTLEGLYAHPRHGGNRGGASWRALSFP